MRETPVFLGLTRRTKFYGVPIEYLITLMLIGVLPFLALNDMRYLLLIIVVYPVMWLTADKNPDFFSIVITALKTTPPTRNKSRYGFERYGKEVVLPSQSLREIIGATIMRDENAAKHIPFVQAFNDNMIITRQGELMSSLLVDGLDSFTADGDDIAGSAGNFARFVGQLGPGIGYYVHKITVPDNVALPRVDADEFSMMVDDKWQSSLAKKGLRKRVIMVSLVVRPNLIEKFNLKSLFVHEEDRVSRELDMSRMAHRLAEATSQLTGSIGVDKCRLLSFEDGEWLGLLGATFGLPYQKRNVDRGKYIGSLLSNADFEFENDIVRISDGFNKKLAAVLTIHSYASSTLPIMLDGLELPHDIVITNSFTPMRNNRALEKVKLVERQMSATDDDAVSDLAALRDTADNLASGRQMYGLHQMTIMVSADNQDDLEVALSEVWQAAQETGVTFVKETSQIGPIKGPLTATFFSQIVGNWSYRTRQKMISADNFADFTAFHKQQSGRTADQSPWGAVITNMPSVASSVYQFNFHDAGKMGDEPTAGHSLVLGRTGSGKTLGTAFLVAQAQRCNPRVIVFDKDQGMEMFIRAMGGSYSAIKMGQATGFNPFQTETDDRGAAWLTDWVLDILSRNKPFETVQSVAVTNAIKQIVSASSNLRNFDGLASLIASTDDDGDLVARVGEWCDGGRYGWMFSRNDANDISMDEGVIGLDMSEILDADIERSALLAYLFRRIERVIEDRRPTIIVIDEAWKMLNDPIVEKRLHDWLVTMRKKNCVVIMLTQTPQHLESSNVGQIIVESVNTQILFPNARAKPDDYKIFRLNSSEADFLSTKPANNRLALVRSGSDSIYVDFDLSGLGGLLTVLGGGQAAIDKAPKDWRESEYFWKEMM